MSKINDIALITQVLVLHDNRGFDALVRKHQQAIRRFFLNQTGGDEFLSDDLAQDTFVKAYENLASFRKLSNFSTWLYRIAYNVFYDYIRTQKPTDDIDAIKRPPLAEHGGYSEVRSDVSKALMMLREEERTCVTLQLIDDFPIDKIAAITGMNKNTVKSHLSRGKEKLANYLKENGYD